MMHRRTIPRWRPAGGGPPSPGDSVTSRKTSTTPPMSSIVCGSERAVSSMGTSAIPGRAAPCGCPGRPLMIRGRPGDRVLDRLPGLFVDDVENSARAAARSLPRAPARQLRRHRVEERDGAVVVRDDHGIADAGERDMQLLALPCDFLGRRLRGPRRPPLQQAAGIFLGRLRSVMSRVTLPKPRSAPVSSRRAVMTTLAQKRVAVLAQRQPSSSKLPSRRGDGHLLVGPAGARRLPGDRKRKNACR